MIDNEIIKQILENQECILAGLNVLITPHCRGSLHDKNGETITNLKIIDCYHKTRRLLGKDKD